MQMRGEAKQVYSERHSVPFKTKHRTGSPLFDESPEMHFQRRAT
jgi:hypothetical protein